MESIIRNVRDIDAGDRHAIEHVVGRQLHDNQRLILHVVELELPAGRPGTDTHPSQSLEDWTRVYDGLTDEEIAEVEKIAFGPVAFSLD